MRELSRQGETQCVNVLEILPVVLAVKVVGFRLRQVKRNDFMIEILDQMPNLTFLFEKSDEAKTVLFEMGLIDKFSQRPLYFHQSTLQAIGYSEHATHFIIGLLYLGKTKPEDNGYLAYCLPKSKYSPQEVIQFREDVLEGQGVSVVRKGLSGKSFEN
jgi:hypothetical protein